MFTARYADGQRLSFSVDYDGRGCSLYGRQINESASGTKSRDQIASVIKSAGCSDSRRFNSRPGRTVLPGLFALPIVDGLGDYSGSHDVPVTSMARTCSGSQAMARFND